MSYGTSYGASGVPPQPGMYATPTSSSTYPSVPQPPSSYNNPTYYGSSYPPKYGNNSGSYDDRDRKERPTTVNATEDVKIPIDYNQLNDAIAFTGVDLKEETEILQKETLYVSGTSTVFEKDRSKFQNFLNQSVLQARTAELGWLIVKERRLVANGDVYDYLGLAAQERIRTLLEQMVMVKNHRIRSNHLYEPLLEPNGTPLYKEVLNQDVRSQLHAIEKAEHEEERRRKERLSKRNKSAKEDEERKEKGRTESSSTGQSKKKKRKETAPKELLKQTNEEKTKMNTNETALKAAGGLTKSWMLTATFDASTPTKTIASPRPATTANGVPGSRKTTTRDSNEDAYLRRTAAQSNAIYNPPQKHPASEEDRITVRDALQVLENDRGGGGAGGVNQKVLMRGYVKYLRDD